MKSLRLTAIVGLAAFASASAGDDNALKKDLVALQGKWNVVKVETASGKNEDGKGATLEFLKDGTVVFTRGDKSKNASYKIDVGAKPQTITLVSEGSTREQIGIYKIEKNVLTICGYAPKGGVIPKDFATNAVKEDGKEKKRTYDLWTLHRAQ